MQGGLGNDTFHGAITVGSSHVSFWGGAGADSFNFSTIAGTAGTAYFWNEGGDDTLVFGSLVSHGSTSYANAFFSVTSGASSNISFADSQALTANSYTNMFGVAGAVLDNTIGFVSGAVGTNMVTLTFGSTSTLGYSSTFGSFVIQGSNAEGITSAFSGYSSTETQLCSVLLRPSQPSADHSFRNPSVENESPLIEGAFLCFSTSRFVWLPPTRLHPSQRRCLPGRRLFYEGDRLSAEVRLFSSAIAGHLHFSELVAGCAQIHRSHGVATEQQPISAFAAFQACQPEPSSPQEAWQQLLPVADLPDALLFWALHRCLPSLAGAEPAKRIRLLQRLASLLCMQWPRRPDLPYQVILRDVTGSLLKSAPQKWLKPGEFYSKPDAYLYQHQVAWAQGRFEAMWMGFLRGQLDGRYFPLSDHHMRGLSILGEAERSLQLFQQLYNHDPAQFQLGSVSNMLFIALGIDQLPQSFVSALTAHFHHLSNQAFASLPLPISSCSSQNLAGEREAFAGSRFSRSAPAPRRPILVADCSSSAFSIPGDQCCGKSSRSGSSPRRAQPAF